MADTAGSRSVGRWIGGLVLVAAGLAMGIGAGFFSVIVASTAECENALRVSHAWICTGAWRAVLGWIEGGLSLAVLLAPLAGGIASALSGRVRWLAIGAAIAFVCVAVQIALAEQQVAVLG